MESIIFYRGWPDRSEPITVVGRASMVVGEGSSGDMTNCRIATVGSSMGTSTMSPTVLTVFCRMTVQARAVAKVGAASGVGAQS